MTKIEFLAQLEKRLAQLPENERKSRLDYYSELIDDMIEDGLSEEEAVERLGSSEEIASRAMRAGAPGAAAQAPAPAKKMGVLGKLAIALLAVVLLVAAAAYALNYLPGSSDAGGNVAAADNQAQFSADGRYEISASVSRLNIDWTYGEVDVKAHRGDVIVLREKGDDARIDESSALAYAEKDGVLTVSYSADGAASARIEKELEVLVPQDMLTELVITVEDADVDIEGLALSKLSVSTTRGGVDAERTSADEIIVSAGAEDVELSLDACPKNAQISAASGDVELELPRGSVFELNASASGKVVDRLGSTAGSENVISVTAERGSVKVEAR